MTTKEVPTSDQDETMECCAKGHLMSGTPHGTEIKIGGLDCYLSRPNNHESLPLSSSSSPSSSSSSSSSIKSCVLILSDVFGWQLPNVRILADRYAAAGFLCVVPDFFKGGALSPNTMDVFIEPADSFWGRLSQGAYFATSLPSMIPFFLKYHKEHTMPLIHAVVHELRSDQHEWKVDTIGTIGYCWGGKYSILAGCPNKNTSSTSDNSPLVDCAVMAHPSRVDVNADVASLAVPTCWLLAESDFAFKPADCALTRKILSKKKEQHQIQFEWYEWKGTSHGFAVRGNEKDEVVRKARDEAFDRSVQFFKKYLNKNQ